MQPTEEKLRLVAETLFAAIHPKGSKKTTWHDYVWLARLVLEALKRRRTTNAV
jgi:hypothetical protein